MENAPDQSEQERLQSYANDLHHRVNFLFQRRGILDPSGETTYELTDDEVDFVASAFTDNFIDAPDTIEITLLDQATDDISADDNHRRVLVITQHEDEDSIYGCLYHVSTGNNMSDALVTKDVLRSPAERDSAEYDESLDETIYDDITLDESERAALLAMIAKL